MIYAELYFLVVVHETDVECVSCFVVEFLAFGDLFGDIGNEFFWCLVFDEWSFDLSHQQMSIEHFGCSFEIDHLSLLVDIVYVVEEAWCSTAAADDDVFKFRQWRSKPREQARAAF